MDYNELEKRIHKLEDIQAIKNLQAKYTYLVDSKKLDEVAELMTDDIVANLIPFGKFDGKTMLMNVLKGMVENSKMMRHQMMNAYLEVDGDKATGRWYLFGPFTAAAPGKDIAHWLQGEYNNEFVRKNGQWKISKLNFTTTFQTPYEDGWVKTPMMSAD